MPRISVHLPDSIMPELVARGNIGEAAREALERYYAILTEGRTMLAGRFTPEELVAIVKATEGEDPDKLGLYGRIQAAGYSLKVQGLAEAFALVDAVERYHRARATGMRVDPAGILG